jgi:hypothetical protein
VIQLTGAARVIGRTSLAGLVAVWALVIVMCAGPISAAQATWGNHGECGISENHHCYALTEHTVTALASIDFVYTMVMDNPEWERGAFTTNEQWIGFSSEPNGWIETGTIGGNGVGTGNSCCSLHPYYAEQLKGVFKETESEGTVPDHTYNHYVLYDAEDNGRWHIYWGCCEVGYYGGGWPTKFNEQEAGVEAAAESEPWAWMHDEVAWSQGGTWYPWTGAKGFTKGDTMCIGANPESPAEGNIEAGTDHGAHEFGLC